MRFAEYVNPGILAKAQADGYVEEKISPCGNFALYDYTRSAMFEGVWNDATLKCRGIVVDRNSDLIVAMCLPKFFNLGEGASHHLKQYKECIDNNIPFVATEKMDGSFGNVWFDKYQQKWRCSTRGSFESDQALWATEWLSLRDIEPTLFGMYNNFIVEIIYPENRVVVDYGDVAELVLLTGYDSNLVELDYAQCNFVHTLLDMAIVHVHNFSSIDEVVSICETLDGNHEGFVLRFENGFRTKIKGLQYCNLHRIISGLSTKAVWENIDYINYEIKKEWLMNVPEEFRPEIEAFGKQLMDSMYEELVMTDAAFMLSTQLAIDIYGGAFTKKNYVVDILQKKFPKAIHSKVLLAYGGKTDQLRELIWKEHQPEFKKMTVVGEDEC